MDIAKGVKGLYKSLRSNMAINDSYFEGAYNGVVNFARKRAYKGNGAIANKMGFGKDADGFVEKEMSDMDALGSLFRNSETGETEYLKRGGIAIAGGYMGLSAAGRVATGGGLYRDSDGNFDLMGIPFI